MIYPPRDIHGPAQSRAIKDLLQSIFSTELVDPSPEIWLTFAWISDLTILDNSSRKYASLAPDWPSSQIKLSQILDALLERGSTIKLVIREEGHNEYFLTKLHSLKSKFKHSIKWCIEEKFHEKGLLGADYFLHGSMNLTLNGVSVNDEHVLFRTNPSDISEQFLELSSRWETRLL